MTNNIELWADGAMVGRGAAALESLPDTPAQRERLMNMLRVETRAVDAQERCDAAKARRDAAMEEQKLAQAIVNEARTSLVKQLCERADTLGQRLDAFARKQARAHLDALPDPDDANQGGELSPVGPTAREPAGDRR
jgi:hypothetical protein